MCYDMPEDNNLSKFMVNEGIVLGHKISEWGIEVDKAKVDAIDKMQCPKDIKGLLKTSLKFLGLLQIFYKRIFHLFLMMIV